MKELEYIQFKNGEEFRGWLQKHYDTSPGLWMVYFKKHTEKECIKYSEALEEALCFGWIDSLIKRIDEERYARKFTPRTNTKKWSEINKSKVIELIKTGRMTPAGLIKTEGYSKSKKADQIIFTTKKKVSKEIHLPDFIHEALVKNEPALTNFNNLSSTYRKHYILWITNARREETIQKRLQESIGLLKENKKLGLK
jgi:uncharacterized protein YdeI (YjbR/CyaY-like superfamily)